MSDNVCALNSTDTGLFQYYPYISQYGQCSDYDAIDMSYGNYGNYGSIFDGYYSGTGLMPFYPGTCYGGSQSYFDNMRDYQRFFMEYNIDQQNMQRNADLKVNASIEGVKNAAAVLQDKIKENEQDQIPKAFEAYVNSVAAAYGEGTEDEIKSRALTLYQQMTGKSLIQDLRENSNSPFIQGAMQSLSFSTVCRRSAEDNISDITGQPVGTGSKAAQDSGRVAGAVGVGAAAGAATGLFSKATAKTAAKGAETAAKAAKSAAKFGKGGIVGLVVGTAALLLSFATGRVST